MIIELNLAGNNIDVGGWADQTKALNELLLSATHMAEPGDVIKFGEAASMFLVGELYFEGPLNDLTFELFGTRFRTDLGPIIHGKNLVSCIFKGGEFDGGGLLFEDCVNISVQHIIVENFYERPVYFARCKETELIDIRYPKDEVPKEEVLDV